MTKTEAKYEAYKIAAVVLGAMASHTPPIVPNTLDVQAVADALQELSELLALRADNIKYSLELEMMGFTESTFNT
ncbi:MAG: hypothetical protein SNJ55_08495 [Chloroherpetonaceae bacterium]